MVGTFVEFYSPAVARIPLVNRATLGNMSPQQGSACAIVWSPALIFPTFNVKMTAIVKIPSPDWK
jgi:hypothetical protein